MLVVALAAALVVVASAFAGGKHGGEGTVAEAPTDQIVVRLVAGATLDDAGLDAAAGVKLKHVRRLDDGRYVLKLPKRARSADVSEITARLAARNDVLSAEPDAMMQPLAIPNDARWPEQWDLFAPAGGSYGANLPGAWDISTGAPGIVVGVIDTGYRPHADLAGRFVAGYDFIGDTLVANDGNGRDADPSDPGDWITSNENASGYFAGCGVGNSSWHGTHVSGTIGAASNNALGVAGINWASKIQPLRVLGKCGGYTSDIADAIRWGAGLPVSGLPANPTPSKVLNLSLGGSGACSSTYQNAINAAVAAGTVVVAAAGNSNSDASAYQPASCANVITVAATGHTGKRAYYSNYGSTVEIAAPGGDSTLGKTILSTLNAGTTTPGADSYANYQGTSMATPHVVGVVSLMQSVNPALTPAQILSMLQASVTPFPAGSTCTPSICGPGIVNAAAAVTLANGGGGGGGGGGPAAPGAFSKTAPKNGARNLAATVSLSWGASSDAASYEWCVSKANGSCSSWTGTTTRSASATLARKTTYYWQVRAVNATATTNANTGTWWSFKTK
jgi:serine protease